MNIIKQVFSPQFLLERRPDPATPFLIIGIIAIISLLVIALIATFLRRKIGKPYSILIAKVTTFIYTVSTVGLFLMFFRWQAIPILSMRLFVLLLSIVSIIWIVNIIYYFLRKFPFVKQQHKQEQIKQKYLRI